MEDFKTSLINSTALPLVIEPPGKKCDRADFFNLVAKHESFLKEKLLTHGGLLFRNFPVDNAADFAALINQLKIGRFMDYVGGDSPRNKIIDGVYTSTEAPPSFRILLHNELSYVKNFPSHICFFCDIAPEAKGETIIGDARKVFHAIDKDVKGRFLERQLRYVSCYCDKNSWMKVINKSHKSWAKVFETDVRTEVERKCQANEIAFQWKQDGWLEISQIRPATAVHPKTREHVWFNQAHLFDFNPRHLGLGYYVATKVLYALPHTRLHQVFFGDNTKIPRDDLYHIMDVLDANTIAFPWQKGDVLVLDNVLAMHGRAAFSGKRRILTAMTG